MIFANSRNLFREAPAILGRKGFRNIHVEAKLEKMGITLPPPGPPAGNFKYTKRVGNMLFTSGHLPIDYKTGVMMKGKVGDDVTDEEAKEASRLIAIQLLGSVKQAIGDLDKIKQLVKLVGFVNAVDKYDKQPFVVNGASDFFVELLEEKGEHARSAVGTNSLPLNIPVEIEAIFEIED